MRSICSSAPDTPLSFPIFLVALIVFGLDGALSDSTQAQSLDWIRGLRTSGDDSIVAVALDGQGGLYVAGSTEGKLGSSSFGLNDMFLARYGTDGDVDWIQQLGTGNTDFASDMVLDQSNNIYIAGTSRTDPFGPNPGIGTSFVSKYDSDGAPGWTRHLGPVATVSPGILTTDLSGSIYVAGKTSETLGEASAGGDDVFLRRYDTEGNVAWTQQVGTEEDEEVLDAVVDRQGNIFITGSTLGSLGGQNAGDNDGYLTKFDANGSLEWTKQFGGDAFDSGRGLWSDASGNVYLVGTISLQKGDDESRDVNAFLNKYTSDGTLVWGVELGTLKPDFGHSVSGDNLGNIYVTGATLGAMEGANAGWHDAFISQFDPAGNRGWTLQLGSAKDDFLANAVADGAGRIYIAGWSGSDLGGKNAGLSDAVLAAIIDLTFVAPIPGDANADGTVDLTDFGLLKAHFGTNGDGSQGDFDGSGTINLTDFGILKQNFGKHAGANVVPEPSTLLLATLAGLGLVAMRVRSKR